MNILWTSTLEDIILGKNYAARKPIEERPESDFYRTPESLSQLLCDTGVLDPFKEIYEPMNGDGAMSSVLHANGHSVMTDDIRATGKDFLDFTGTVDYICTNPAFSIFSETVEKCDEVCKYGYTLLGKTNFFAAHSRNVMGTWKHLKHVYVFDRMVDYRTPAGNNGNFFVGLLVTGWFVFDKAWDKGSWSMSVLDVNKWATLGSYDNYLKKQEELKLKNAL